MPSRRPPPLDRPRTRRGLRAGLWATAALAAAWASSAGALDLGDDDTGLTETVAHRQALKSYDNIKKYGAERIVERDRKPFRPDGIRIGNYVIFPEAGSKLVFDDNIFASPSNRVADLRHELTSKVRLESHLPRHVLDFSFGGKLVSYLEHDQLDHADAFATANGALHFNHAHTLSVGLLSALEHEDLLDPSAPEDAAELTPVWHNRASMTLKRDAGRLYGSIGVRAESWDYQDVEARDGSTIDQDFRDVSIFSSQLTLGYRFSPGYELQANFRVLRQETPTAGSEDLDADGYEATAGLAAEINPLVRWRLMGGYGVRDYDQPGLETAASSLLEAELQWLPTQLMTITAGARRQISDGVTSDGASGRIDTSLSARLDYEVRRNLVFTLQGEYRDSDFIGEARHDQLATGRIGLEFLWTKNWLLSLGYEHQHRESNVDEFDLTRNKVWVGAKFRF
jgi:hypothetical protein